MQIQNHVNIVGLFYTSSSAVSTRGIRCKLSDLVIKTLFILQETICPIVLGRLQIVHAQNLNCHGPHGAGRRFCSLGERVSTIKGSSRGFWGVLGISVGG